MTAELAAFGNIILAYVSVIFNALRKMIAQSRNASALVAMPSMLVRTLEARRKLSSAPHRHLENTMANEKGPNVKKKQKCKNCEGKGLLKKGDKVVRCQRCGGTGVR